MCRIFLGLCNFTADARGNPTSLQMVRTARCVTPDVASPQTIFGIDVYAVLKHPVVPIPWKCMCISAEPNIDIRIGVHHFNLLNATVAVGVPRCVSQVDVQLHKARHRERVHVRDSDHVCGHAARC